MKKCSAVVLSLTFGLGLTGVTATAQQAPVNLGSTSTFAVLAGTTVTVTGAGTITGDVGVFPGTAYVPGTPPVTVNGLVYAGGPVAAQAQTDLATAYNDAAGRSVNPITVAGNIGGQTLVPGLYKSTSSLAISSGNLTLDAQGNANAVWIFQIASTLTTTSGLQVALANGAKAANIFWQVGSSATIGTTSVFQGNILAATSISMLTGSTLTGRALAIGGAVTIDTGGGSSATIPVAGTAPAINTAGVVNGASFVSPVAAGSIAAVFGTNLAIMQESSNAPTPLPNDLEQTYVTIGSQYAPLYFAKFTQVNLQIPWELAGQTQTSIVANVGGVVSNTLTVPLAPFAPGIFAVDSTGAGQGAVLIAPTAELAGPATPAPRGEYISIFCTGLGAVTNQPATGAAAPGFPYSLTKTTPTVTIGGVGAVVYYSGLAPGYVGLYQVNVLVPMSVTPGNTVPIVLSIGTATSNTVTIAVM